MNENVPEHPVSMATAATCAFIESAVPGPASILEVGCGNGHVAAALLKRGYAVIGVEHDEAAVLAARKLGVDVIEGSWPDITVKPVDAVVFTRSLHHITPLRKAVEKTRDVLLPHGTVLVEDFAYDQANPQAIDWLVKTALSERSRALISHHASSFIAKLLNAHDPTRFWEQDHDHDLHTFEAMIHAIETVFEIRNTLRVPYLYRYLIEALPNTPEAAAFISDVYDEESRLGKTGTFSLVGRRILAIER